MFRRKRRGLLQMLSSRLAGIDGPPWGLVHRVLTTTKVDLTTPAALQPQNFVVTKTKGMKIVITGSLGNISRPLAQSLVQKGHGVSVISSKVEKKAEIEALGAVAAIGSIEDIQFLTATFKGADVVYCMVPPSYFYTGVEPIAYYRQIGASYVQAIRASGVKRAILLSSFGAELTKGTGFILGSHYVENMFNELSDVDIVTMRPTSFFYNLLGFIDVIKHTGSIVSNYGGNDRIPFVAPVDIASAIVEEIEAAPTHRKIRYVSSEELTGNEVARVLGEAIGKPDLQWHVISDEAAREGMTAAGLPPMIVSNLVELNASMHSGELAKGYERNRPEKFGPTKLKDFARVFTSAYDQKK